jgi:flagellar hook-associated protein 3 FlgL
MNRVTATTGSRMSLANIQATAKRLNHAQEQISSGKQVRKPSDGPAQVLSALDYRAQIRRTQQLERNILDARSWLDNADSALTHSVEQLTRAKTPGARRCERICRRRCPVRVCRRDRDDRRGLMQTANTQHLGRPIFGGTNGALGRL